MRDPSPYAGQTVKLRPDAAEIGGHPAEVVDWWASAKTKLADEAADFKAQDYTVRGGRDGLPADDDMLYARIDGMMRIIHVTEIEGFEPSPMQNPRGPALADQRAVGQPCPACQVPIAANDLVAVIMLGPGADPAARFKARTGIDYEAVAIEIHWPCHTGDESYGKAEG